MGLLLSIVTSLFYFSSGLTDDDLRETAYEILLAAAGASGYIPNFEACESRYYLVIKWLNIYNSNCSMSRGLIVPSKEKKKDKKSRLLRKLGRSKSEQIANQSHYSSGLVGLLEIMRVQMEVSSVHSFSFFFSFFYSVRHTSHFC